MEFIQNKEKVCVIIPTFNRKELISLVLDEIKRYFGTLFTFEIHDSSTNNETRELIVHSGISDKKLKYFQCSSEMSADYKAARAVLSCDKNYIWLMGDGLVVDFNEIDRLLRFSSYKDYSIIELSPQKKGVDENTLFIPDDYGSFFEQHFSHLTFWGASILKKEVFELFFSTKNIQQYVENVRWWVALCIFEYINHEKNSGKDIGIGYMYSGSVKNNPYKTSHYWTNGETYYLWAIKMLNEAVLSLPAMYDSYKIRAIASFRRDRLVSNRFLFRLRAKGTLNLKMVRKYKSEIKIVNGFYSKMVFISCIPRRNLKAIENLYDYAASIRKKRVWNG